MALIRLIYASRMSGPLSMSTIVEILDAAVRHNRQHGITGVLVFAADRFLQALEGEADAVDLLYERILRDPRHRDVQLLSSEAADERMFGQWAMGSVDLGRSMVGATAIDSARFDPHALTPAQALSLLWQVAGAQVLPAELLAGTPTV
jgi:hypothetical protein